MTSAWRNRLVALAAAAVLPVLAGSAHAAGGPPYALTIAGPGQLVASPAGGGSTLAVAVTQTASTVRFSPAAAAFPSGVDECATTLEATTCDAGLVAGELRLSAAIVEARVAGLSTALLTFSGGEAGDSLVVDGPGAIGTVALNPGAGADAVTLRGSIDAITLAPGDSGSDRYVIESTNATIGGTLALGDGNDVASSRAPNLTLDGGAGDDVLSGAGPLVGDAGSDVLMPTVDDKTAIGGDGAGDTDRLSFELVAGPLTLQKVAPGDVQVVGTAFSGSGIEHLEGSPGNDVMLGSAGRDVLLGGQGNDLIAGQGGGDLLDGGPGVNSISYASATGPVVIDLVTGIGTTSGLTDTLRSFRSVTTGSGNDNVMGSAAAESFTLGAGDDVVHAGHGDDAIDGGAGNDLLRGGHGDDAINGGDGSDTATYDERLQSEPLNVTLATPGGDGAAGENDMLLAIENVIGGASNDIITGDDGANYLGGGAGLDVLDGLGGNDAIYGGGGRDAISGGAGQDVLFGEGDDDSINAFDGEPDVVDCGASLDDDAQIDASDNATGCEYARRGDVPVPVDADGDGFVAGFDCDDADPAINPGATDIVGDRIDQNCDGFDEPVPFVDYGLSLSFSKATARGRRVTRLVVRDLPRSHRVRVSCKATKRYARRCPFKHRTKRPSRAGNVSLTSLFRKRVLPPGTTIELQITAPGFNGRVRRFTVRRAGAVRDRRLCLLQGRRAPRTCPAGED